jgi:hypothetical protein
MVRPARGGLSGIEDPDDIIGDIAQALEDV